jgi:copper amine oxidase-like protein
MRMLVIALIACVLFVISAWTAGQAKSIDQILASDIRVRLALGPAYEIVRVEPVAVHHGEFVVDAATPDRSRGIRTLVNLQTESVLRIGPLKSVDIIFLTADAEKAFAIVRNLPSIRALLGAAIGQYRITSADDSGLPGYRVDAIPVRGIGHRDVCATHRCLDLLFRTPSGYLKAPHVLVDLTADRRIGGPASERSIAPVEQPSRARHLSAVVPNMGCHEIIFPSAPTSWHICWTRDAGFGMVIGPMSFKRGPFAPFDVLGDARVDQIFVPYASGAPRYYDVNYDFPLAFIAQSLCPGTLLDGGRACLEIRDRDIDWMASPFGSRFLNGRRGQEAVFWSVLDADNYQYVEQWGFRDDGIFWGRVGATGRNLPTLETESHTHDFVWRIAPHLNGSGNSINHVTLYEPVNQLAAQDVVTAVPMPAGLLWNPVTFDQLEVYPPGANNERGDPISYRLVALPTGGLAHHNEPFTQDDLWATAGDPTETDASHLPDYAKEQRSLVDTDVTIWYRGSVHHQPRDEDGYYGYAGWNGTTHTMWTGFAFVPRNLFAKSPNYP